MTKTYYKILPQGEQELSAWLSEPLNALPPTRDEFSMKLYLLNDARNPLVKELFAQEIARHEEKLQYLESRWEALFAWEAEQAKHYGHSLILRQAINREKQRLQWLREEQAKLPK